MTPFVLLPVKPPAEAKSRLRGMLSDAERAELARRIFDHVLKTTLQVVDSNKILVICRDPSVLDGAAKRGARTVREPGENGLNAALAAGRAEAVRRGADAVLVLPGDLPSLSADDIDALIAVGSASGVVIAPDSRDRGTNALMLSPPDLLPFAFGEESFAAHLMAARTRGIEAAVVRRPGLAFDVDTADDYARLRRLESHRAAG